MSDNVSQLQPQKKPGLGKRIAAFVLLAVLVAGGVAAYVFRDQLNLDALQRYVRYLNVSDDSKSGRFLYDESNSNQYAGLSGGLAVASATGLSLYDKDGTETAECDHGCGATDTRTKEGTKLPDENPPTGDSGWWIAGIAIAAAAGTVALLFYRKKAIG